MPIFLLEGLDGGGVRNSLPTKQEELFVSYILKDSNDSQKAQKKETARSNGN